MKIMKVKIKKLNENAVIPKYAKSGDAGMDITAVSKHYDEYGNVVYGTGLAFEIPERYVGLLFPRSSNSKQDLILSNSIGVLDSGYRGEVMFKFKPSLFFGDNEYAEEGTVGQISETFDSIEIPLTNRYDYTEYFVGDRIGQIIILPYPQIEFEEVEELSTTDRGEGGFGSTGN